MKTPFIIAVLLLATPWARAEPGVRQISQDMLPLTITQPGCYRVVAPLSFAGLTNGVSIQANGVTIDLNGFTFVGPGSSSGHGIHQGSAYRDAEVRNGTVRNWQGAVSFGVHLEGVNNRVVGVRAIGCGSGIFVGDNSRVESCVVSGISSTDFGYGISAGQGSGVELCVVHDGDSDIVMTGIFLGEGASARRCVVRDLNASPVVYGIAGEGRNIAERCAVGSLQGNDGAAGIQLADGGEVRQCSVQGVSAATAAGGSQGIYGNGVRVEQCAVYGCGGSSTNGAGIYLFRNGVARENAVRGNRYSGIEAYQDNLVSRNVSGLNGNGSDGAAGVEVTGEGNRIEENHLVLNHYGVRDAATNSFFMRNSLHANTQAGSVASTNHMPDSLLRPGPDFNALATPYNFQDVIW